MINVYYIDSNSALLLNALNLDSHAKVHLWEEEVAPEAGSCPG
jgi:hypothetical protein